MNKSVLGDYELPINLTLLHEKVKKALLKNAEVRTRAFNKNKRLVEYHIGDLVKLRTFPKSDASKKEAAKLFKKYEGPFVIAAVPYANTYTLFDNNTKKIKGNYNAVHLSRFYVF